MLSQILTNTPKWVFVLFVVLLALGIVQFRTRTMPLRRVIIMPIVFLALSLSGVVTAFGWSAEPLVAWAAGYMLIAWLMVQGLPSQGHSYDATTRKFTVAGSSLPLALMMGIFFLKYFVGVSKGIHADFTEQAFFPIGIALLYGAFSGAFAGRAWRLIRLTRKI